jgi:protein dithiol oxidoreductase (disulfide-forming)
MNCATIDAILDEHRTATLSPTERQPVAAHLAACSRCTHSWEANDALLRDDVGDPPPELWARVRQAAESPPGPRMWRRAAGALAAAAAVGAAALFVVRPWATTPEKPPAVAAAPARAFVAGRDYEVLARPAASVTEGKIGVTEFFMYPCFHCFVFEGELTDWATRSAGNVALTRVPVIFNSQTELLARAFYAAEALGKGDAMHAAFYEEMHTRSNSLASREALAGIFARFGVDAAAFDTAFDSAAVAARVQEAAALGRQYRINATPTLVVAGRYSTNPTVSGGRMLQVVEQLVADERRAAIRK